MARLDDSYDVLVVGIGSMGVAAARTLAARGLRVLGLETFGPAHDQGSAHGDTRIVRQSYFESPAYVPLLRRACLTPLGIEVRYRPTSQLPVPDAAFDLVLKHTRSSLGGPPGQVEVVPGKRL